MSDPDTYGESSSRSALLRGLEATAAKTAAAPATVPCPSERGGVGGSTPPRSPAPLAILVATGSYNPAHVDHVGIMGQARGLLEREGYLVAGGLMSPSCQRYVKCKLGDGALPAAWRASIVQAGIEGAGLDGWLRADRWEADQGGFMDHPYVGRSLREFLRRRVAPEVFERVRIFYVAGGDLYNACCKWGHDEHFDGVVAAAREGETEEVVKNMRRRRGGGGGGDSDSDSDSDGDGDGDRVPRVGGGGRPHFLLRPVPGSARIPHVSSTLVRDAMQRGDLEVAEEAMGTKAYEEFRRLCAGGEARDL